MFTRPAWLLGLEEGALLIAAVSLYQHFHFSWILFAALFFAPDLFMLGYLANPRLGAGMYNLGHFVVIPLVLLAAGYSGNRPLLMAIGLIWICHIAFDRMLGYGLKYPSAFKDTHLQRVL